MPVFSPIVIRFGRIGDMILLTPLLHLLHRRYGKPCRVLCSGGWTTTLLAGNADVDAIWDLQARHRPLLLSPEQWRLVRALRAEKFAPVYVVEDQPRALRRARRLLQLGGVAANRIVYLTDRPELRQMHWIDRTLQLGKETPPALRDSDHSWTPADLWSAARLQIDAEDRADRDRWLRERGLDGHAIVLLQTGNKRTAKTLRRGDSDAKAWPVERWTQLLQSMRTVLPSATFLLCGSPAESDLLMRIKRATSGERVQIACTDLPLRRMLGVMEVAHSMVSVDTGPAHAAAAVGCPLVVLYGDEQASVWHRRGTHGKPVINLESFDQSRRATGISIDEVLSAWQKLSA